MYNSFDNTWDAGASLVMPPLLPCKFIHPSQWPQFWPDEQQVLKIQSSLGRCLVPKKSMSSKLCVSLICFALP